VRRLLVSALSLERLLVLALPGWLNWLAIH
jgi:hypothetical protein